MSDQRKAAVLHELEEAAMHLEQLARAVEKDEIDWSREAIEFGIRLGHVQEHICLAWHSKDDLPKSDKDAAYRVPNFGFSFSLVDP